MGGFRVKKLVLSLFAGILALSFLAGCGEIKEEYKPDPEQLEKAKG